MNLTGLQALTDEELSAALKMIPGNKNLPRRPRPEIPVPGRKDAVTRLKDIQSYIASFEYNHTGVSFVKKRRDRGASHVLTTAKELIRESLPIQCVEAVFIALLLTNEMDDITVYPLSFKSAVGKQVYRHIVLAVTANGKWGALGISRCKELMGKDLRFATMSDLINDFKKSYAGVCHELLKVYVALPFTRETSGPIRWRALNLEMGRPWEDIAEATRLFTQRGRGLVEYFDRVGQLPLECTAFSSKETNAVSKQGGAEDGTSDDSESEGGEGAGAEKKGEDDPTPVNGKALIKGPKKTKRGAKGGNSGLPKGRLFGV
mmetsp:Transcript_6842/g.12703  ORF Transcript_6842/g.12703 Transcript_6842/m.12703 type:complete len:318 (+) Transcript_6842:158-1111(+)|eukprot:CAMPEP_0171633848 /NCGR_PEP_ID=MMETSP0990-20121206/25503_1 /TAXON_ID=483369 /ORGANISM="non described non described, Strain CCMP2098" /LENGTH=317 /DNA_ID=CAMNT_0012204755 /DNA_START=82 /DNA_END=1035 /DNA_ORIENTATION=+